MRLERVTDQQTQEHGRLQEYGQLLHDQEETQRQLRAAMEGAGASAAAPTPNGDHNTAAAVTEATAPVPPARAVILGMGGPGAEAAIVACTAPGHFRPHHRLDVAAE